MTNKQELFSISCPNRVVIRTCTWIHFSCGKSGPKEIRSQKIFTLLGLSLYLLSYLTSRAFLKPTFPQYFPSSQSFFFIFTPKFSLTYSTNTKENFDFPSKIRIPNGAFNTPLCRTRYHQVIYCKIAELSRLLKKGAKLLALKKIAGFKFEYAINNLFCIHFYF